MPNHLACQLEAVDQYGRSTQENIFISEFSLNESRLAFISDRGIVETEVDLKNVFAIEPHGTCGIAMQTPSGTILLKSNGSGEGEGSLIDFKNELVALHRQYTGGLDDQGMVGNEPCADKAKREASVIINQGDEHHDIYMNESNGDYIRGVLFDKYGKLILHRHPNAKYAKISQVYIHVDQIVKRGDRLMEISETGPNGNTATITLTYESEQTISIYSVALPESEIGEETEGMLFFELECKKTELPDEGSLGLIRMPVDGSRSHPYIEIKQKVEVGAVIDKGETVCIVEIDDGNQSLGNQSVKAPCRLCVTKSGDNFDADTNIFMGGVLIEYLRLPERSIKYSKQGGAKPKKRSRKAIRIAEPCCIDNDFTSGLDTRWTRKLFVDHEIDAESSEIIKWFCSKNSVLERGDEIARVRDKCADGEIVWYDVYYDGVYPIRIFTTCGNDAEDKIIELDIMEEVCSAYIVINEGELIPAQGEYGLIRMPFRDDEMQLISIVNWKASPGEIYDKNYKICEITTLDRNSDTLEQFMIVAPCRLQVSSVDFDSSKTVYTNGILLEYLRLHEVDQASRNPQRQTTYRNSGQGRKEEVIDKQIQRDTLYRNRGAGSLEILGLPAQDFHLKDNSKNGTSTITQEVLNDVKNYIFRTDNNYFFHGKISTWDETKTFYQKNNIICEITCFATPAPYTHVIRAERDLHITTRVATEDQKIINGDVLFRYRTESIKSPSPSQALNNSSTDHSANYASHGFAYKTIIDISSCTGKSRSEIANVCKQLNCSEPFSLVYADRIADKLMGYPSIRRAWEEKNSDNTSTKQGNMISSINQITNPIEGVDNLISLVKDGYAFQVRDVLERIVNAERERIETERGLWKLGAGIIALGVGVSLDGFDAGDLFAGWTFSNIGGAAHQFASKEQVEFLKKLQSEWLVLDRSPMDIRRRLGEPQGRFIGISQANILDMFNIHQSGSRGFHMVELDCAGNIAKGFKDPQSLEVLQRSYDEEDIGIISSHLYPSTITPLKLCRTITAEEAKKKDPYFNQLSKAGAPFRVVYHDDTEGVMYKIQIPHHSDY